MDDVLKKIGLPDDKKYVSDTVFFDNITVCRFIQSPGKRFMERVRELQDVEVGELLVDKVPLVTGNAVLPAETREIINTYQLSSR